ncbi:hypothetical protein N566_10960 [Streptomycetaceae bacterium MP113-05]|nr:hypothetical protein N566_10960 [Streptomycetaceae bacterium MP113-05]
MDIHWAALVNVFGVSLLASVTLVGVFTVGIAGSSPRKDGGSASVLARTGAYACFAVCAAAVAYGIHLIAA